MNTLFRSFSAACVILACVITCTIGFIAPKLPRRVVGSPAVKHERVIRYDAVQQVMLENADGEDFLITVQGGQVVQLGEISTDLSLP